MHIAHKSYRLLLVLIGVLLHPFLELEHFSPHYMEMSDIYKEIFFFVPPTKVKHICSWLSRMRPCQAISPCWHLSNLAHFYLTDEFVPEYCSLNEYAQSSTSTTEDIISIFSTRLFFCRLLMII